jgi:hypothetical protein
MAASFSLVKYDNLSRVSEQFAMEHGRFIDDLPIE